MDVGYDLALLYRGSLKSCNYSCPYCPFATRRENRDELTVDQAALERFVQWIEQQIDVSLGVLFIPYGEALIHQHYREAIVNLSRLSHVNKLAIQTNLSYPVDWLKEALVDKVALWISYHPSEMEHDVFLDRCQELTQLGIRYSVGLVGIHDNMEKARRVREDLSSDVYVWINAFKHEENYYTDGDMEFWQSIDPLFQFNLHHYQSLGKTCRAGESVLFIDAYGNAKRCPFVSESLGNIYDSELKRLKTVTPCSNPTCHCHIGYVHLRELGLYEVFGSGVLERIPRLERV